MCIRDRHNIVKKASEEGSHVIIIGNPEHPEVQGIMGWSLLPVTVIQDAEEAEQLSLPEEQKICICLLYTSRCV